MLFDYWSYSSIFSFALRITLIFSWSTKALLSFDNLLSSFSNFYVFDLNAFEFI